MRTSTKRKDLAWARIEGPAGVVPATAGREQADLGSNLSRPASQVPPAGGAAPAPASFTLSNGLTLPPTARPLRALAGAYDMPFPDYLSHPAPGRSALDKIRISPLHFRHCLEHISPSSRAQTRGRVAHRLLFDPKKFWLETVVWPIQYDPELDAGGSKTTGTGSKKRWEAFQAKHAGKDIITGEDAETLLEIEELFRSHSLTREVMVGATVESTVFFERDGVLCKARADIARPEEGIIDDLKTTHDLQEFQRSIEKWGYHRQAEWYLDAYTKATGRSFHTFRLIAVQLPPETEGGRTKMPVDVAVFTIGEDLLEDARQENDFHLSIYKRCVETGSWPGFAPVAPLVVGRAPWRVRA